MESRKCILVGTTVWKLPDGTYHREDGPAVTWEDGSTMWYFHDELHREDGPAIEYASGKQQWHIHGKLHRLDGPAIIWNNVANNTSWWINGRDVSDEIIPWAKEMGIDLDNLSEDDKVIIAMVWSDYEE